eukprot:jgi/Ulvmu1/10335/UM061_0018.1
MASGNSGSKIAVIGAGSVGAAVSYALLLRQVASELLIVDIDRKRAQGEVDDLSDGAFITNSNVRVGTLQEAGQCDIVVITAGAKQREGESRVQLIDRNFEILKSVVGGMRPLKPSTKIVVVANPVDVLTYFAQKLAGLPESQVFGSGTYLDTARLRNSIAKKTGVADTAVHVYVLGEHGDSQFVAWSRATIAGTNLTEFPEFADKNVRKQVAEKTKNRAYEIIRSKGATYFGIAAVVSSICQTMFLDQKHVRPLSVMSSDFKVYIGQLAVLGSKGIERIIPMQLDPEEDAAMKASAKHLCSIIQKYEPKLSQ